MEEVWSGDVFDEHFQEINLENLTLLLLLYYFFSPTSPFAELKAHRIARSFCFAKIENLIYDLKAAFGKLEENVFLGK